MAGFFSKIKGVGSGTKSDSSASVKHKKDESPQDLTPVEKLWQNAGPVREDGSDKFFGLENFGNTCYCNSIVQALYHSEHFRENVVNYPPPSPWDGPNKTDTKVSVTIRPPVQANGIAAGPGKQGQPAKPTQSFGGAHFAPGVTPVRPEDKPDSPEYKKKQAMIRGPVLELAQESPAPYGMEECTFTGLKDIFTALIESQSRTGVLSPQRFLDIFKRNNEMFRNSMHQDAHEFYGIVLNDVIANVEANDRRMLELAKSRKSEDESQAAGAASSKADAASPARPSGAGWVHDIFEGVLTSETKCLTCETASQRDETFLDLSIDLEEHSSVTSCLLNFSAEEMLCERNKFHCDHCGGLQEAEKRMKVKKLPKVLALHLKRFKYTEDYSRLQKLFHRVVYPYHLRMFNTTDDAEDPDRMYELYAVVVHIGGNAYHGHYVAVIKTKDRGWLLFDDEMVEPVDKHFVRNFFGDKPGMACAYVLFYQETTFERVREELDAEGVDPVVDVSTAAELNGASSAPLSKLHSQPLPPVDENAGLAALDHIKSAPTTLDVVSPVDQLPPPLSQSEVHPLVAAPPRPAAAMTAAAETAGPPSKSKEELGREKKEQKAREKAEEKARKAAEKEQARIAAKEREEALQRRRETARVEREQLQQAIQESKQMAAEQEKRQKRKGSVAAAAAAAAAAAEGDVDSPQKNGFLNRAGRSSKSMTRKSFAFLQIKQSKDGEKADSKTDKADRAGEASDKGESSSDAPAASASASASATSSGGKNADFPPQDDPHPPPTPAPAPASTPPPSSLPLQNGSSTGAGGKHSTRFPPWMTPRSETAPGATASPRPDSKGAGGEAGPGDKDGKLPLKERFSFSMGRKKSSRFMSPPS